MELRRLVSFAKNSAVADGLLSRYLNNSTATALRFETVTHADFAPSKLRQMSLLRNACWKSGPAASTLRELLRSWATAPIWRLGMLYE